MSPRLDVQWSDTPILVRRLVPLLVLVVIALYATSLYRHRVSAWPGAVKVTPDSARVAYDRMAKCANVRAHTAFDHIDWWTVDSIPEHEAPHPAGVAVGGVFVSSHGFGRSAIVTVKDAPVYLLEHESLHAIISLPSVTNDEHPREPFDRCAPGGTERSFRL